MTDETSVLRPISLDEVREKARGTVIEIPDWAGEGTVAVRVRAIDMSAHIAGLGKLPNTLKVAANEVFHGVSLDTVEEHAAETLDFEGVTEVMPVIDGVARAVLLEPTFDEFAELYPLTMAQKMSLFRFAMGGIDKLESFRS